jgi:signal transduction histidine kinase
VAQGLGRGMVGGLRLDPDGTVWAATEGGLSRIRNGRIHTLTAEHGLPCDGVHWATEDNDRALWLYTPCGLARIARSQIEAWTRAVDSGRDRLPSVQATLFDSSDGVRIHTAPGGYTPSVSKSPDGRIWFLPWDGVSVIDPRRLPINELPPLVHIEQITADGRQYAPTPGLRLPPLTRDITIDYTALSLVAPEKIRFRYQLEGQDPQWREVVNDRRVQYSNIGPGQYHFRVMASNNSGVWNEVGAQLEFAIAPAYYQTAWFRVLSIATIVTVLGAAFRYRIRRLRHEERKLSGRLIQAQEEERSRIGRELHDDISQSLGLLAIKIDQLRADPATPSPVGCTLDALKHDVGDVAADVHRLSHQLHSSTLDYLGLVPAVRRLVDDFSHLHGISVAFADESQAAAVPPDVALSLFRIVQESLNNVAKHSHARSVRVRLTSMAERVHLAVEDDGIGFNATGFDRHAGLGFVSMRERLRMVNGTVRVDSAPGRGTRIDVDVPISRSAPPSRDDTRRGAPGESPLASS